MPDPRFRVVRTGGYEVIEVDELIDQIELGLSKSPPGISTQQIESAAFTPARRHGYASQEVDAWLDLVLAELRSRADGTVTSHRPPDGPSGFSSAEKTAVQPRAVDRPPSSVGSAAGDQLILR